MKWLEIWKRIGKQPIKITQNNDVKAFYGDKEYVVKSIRYEHGKPVGFELDIIQDSWIPASLKPRKDEFVIIKTKNGKIYYFYSWDGNYWFEYVPDEDGALNGEISNVEVASWRYM